MFENLKHKFHVKMFYRYHSSYYTKWMNSISKCDLSTLEEEFEAIQWAKENDVDKEYYKYQLEMLNAQEAIVRRLIDEIKGASHMFKSTTKTLNAEVEAENQRLKEVLCAAGLTCDAGERLTNTEYRTFLISRLKHVPGIIEMLRKENRELKEKVEGFK